MERWGGKCRLDFCDSDVWTRGYCKYHYVQWYRGKPFKVRTAAVQRNEECKFEGCDRSAHARGYCSPHATQLRKGEELTPKPRHKVKGICSFEGCDRELRSKGLCSAHYGQSRRGDGTLSKLRDYFSPEGECFISWCEGDTDSRGLCKFHRGQSRRYNLSNEHLLELYQNNVCDVCGNPPEHNKNLHIDHDHSCCPGTKSCGKCVRGLLCARCNLGLGRFEDDVKLLYALTNYLNRTKVPNG